jgi:hypothetical protein
MALHTCADVGGSQHTPVMHQPSVGSAAIAAKALTRHALRSGFVALHQDVYIAMGAPISPVVRAKACWLRRYPAVALHPALIGRRRLHVVGFCLEDRTGFGLLRGLLGRGVSGH